MAYETFNIHRRITGSKDLLNAPTFFNLLYKFLFSLGMACKSTKKQQAERLDLQPLGELAFNSPDLAVAFKYSYVNMVEDVKKV